MNFELAIAFTSGFSVAAHAGQKRKYTGEDYSQHPKRVAEILDRHGYGNNLEVLITALLHDVVEDTHVTIEQIEQYFGAEIAGMVGWLTKKDWTGPEGRQLKRWEKKELEADRLKSAPAIVKTIKLADRLDNTPDIIVNEPKFAPVFVAETRHLLDHALKEGDPVLWAKVDKIVCDFYEKDACQAT